MGDTRSLRMEMSTLPHSDEGLELSTTYAHSYFFNKDHADERREWQSLWKWPLNGLSKLLAQGSNRQRVQGYINVEDVNFGHILRPFAQINLAAARSRLLNLTRYPPWSSL